MLELNKVNNCYWVCHYFTFLFELIQVEITKGDKHKSNKRENFNPSIVLTTKNFFNTRRTLPNLTPNLPSYFQGSHIFGVPFRL